MKDYIAEKIKNRVDLTKEDLLRISEKDLDVIIDIFNYVKEFIPKQKLDSCSIINGKSGICYEDCKFCAQSVNSGAKIDRFPLISEEKIIEKANYYGNKGVCRFSVVTSGGKMTNREIEKLCSAYSKLSKSSNINLCSSNGELTIEQFKKLKDSGLKRYHCNLETSRSFFPKICSTHSYDDKIKTIKNAQSVGLEICCGGIIGMGESMEDRIDLILEARSLNVDSIPINILNPIKGTDFEDRELLSYDEIVKSVIIFKLAFPKSALRIAGGRNQLKDFGRGLFDFGVTALLTGDFLTTKGAVVDDDLEFLGGI